MSRSSENGEVHLEPEKVEEEGHNDQANSASSEVLAELGKRQRTLAAVDVHEVPEVDHDRYTDGEEGKDTDVFDGDDAAQADTRQEEPLPPFPTECSVTLLVKANVGEHRERHEEDERSVEKDQARLANVGVVEEHETGRSDAGWQRVARLPHDHEDDRNGKGAERGGHGAVCDIWDLVRDVGIANVLEEEVALVSDDPASEGKEELSERRMDIEEVGSLQVV
jgi:hypothetical protein